ncbi:MAG: chemotaxis protein CheW [Proteobacteria bacterium]|nr:chemotaxis protein CheW [Pseudomonadota bacterium]
MNNANDNANLDVTEYVTVMINEQLFGLPIARVEDVFMPVRMTRVPLSAAEIAGVLNLRGRIVTAIDMRRRLGLDKREDSRPPMAIGIEFKGESYGLVIDSVGEVLKLSESAREVNPVNLDARLARVSAGIFRLDGKLLVVLDVDRVLDLGSETLAA